MHVIHIPPTAPVHRLQKRRKPDVRKHRVPVQRKLQIPHRPLRRPRGIVLMRQNHRRRRGHAQLRCQRIVEKLIVRRPPERIIDDRRPVQHRMFQKCPVKRNVVRDAIHNHRPRRRPIQPNRPNLHKLRRNPVEILPVDLFHQRARKSILHAEQHADLFHVGHLSSSCTKRVRAHARSGRASGDGSTLADLRCPCKKARVEKPRFSPSARTHRRFSASSSSSVRGQSCFNSRDSPRSASSLPPVWHRAQ